MAATIPAQVDDITTEWLNSVLGDEFGTIASVEITHFGEGVGILGELARLTLSYEPGQDGPATIVAKCASTSEANQFLAVAMGFYVREVNFYQQLGDRLNIRVPRCFHAASSETGVPFVLLIEEIAGATTPDQVAGISPVDAERIISTITDLHVQFWGDTAALEALDWLPPMNNEMYRGGQAIATAVYPGFAERYGDMIPPDFMVDIGRSCDRYADMLDFVTALGTPTVTHTDCRAENYLFGGMEGDTATTVIDFQLSTRHVGMWDVTNLIAGSMTVEDRREHEHRLIELYVDRVTAHGIEFSVEQAWREYRACLMQQTAAIVITSDLEGGNDRGDDLLEQLRLRPLHAAMDNDALVMLSEF